MKAGRPGAEPGPSSVRCTTNERADALNWIRRLSFGGSLYGVAAFGPASFGAYDLIQARYRVVRAPAVNRDIKDAATMSASLVGFAGRNEGNQ